MFNHVRMTLKLPLAFVTLTLLIALAISFMGYRDFRASLVEQSTERLQILTKERGLAIESWFNGLTAQVEGYGDDPTVIKALQGFSTTFGLVMEDPVRDLQAGYITDNPHPLGAKDQLDRAEGAVPYNYIHADFHPFFRTIKDSLGLYDIFLFDLKGNLVYSVYKEADFATNFLDGPFSDSGLGVSLRMALEGNPTQSHFVDFAPYAPSAGAPAAFMSSAVRNGDEVIGVFAIQLPADEMSKIVANGEGLWDTGELTMIASDFKARSNSRHTDRYSIFDDVSPHSSISTVFEGQDISYYDQPDLNGAQAIGYGRSLDILGETWVLLGEMELTEVYAAATAQRNKTLMFTAVMIAVVALISWFISRSFTNPLDSVVKAMGRVSDKQYNIADLDLDRKDEMGDLSRALGAMTDRLKEFDAQQVAEQEKITEQEAAVVELGTAIKRLAAGDLSAPLMRKFSPEYDPLRIDYNETLSTLGATITEIRDFAEMIGSQTIKMGEDARELSRRTESQAATLEETAAAIDEITSSVSESSEGLKSAQKRVIETDERAKESRKVVDNTTQAMSAIEDSSKEISHIVSVVDDIAFQTNLLALNAGVEAARAGEAGRGFAVVASEVRQLAQRSTEAVSQIKALISTSSANVENGVTLVSDTKTALVDIIDAMGSIAVDITAVASSADEQSSGIREVNIGVSQLDQVTQQNAAMVETSNSDMQSLQGEARKLSASLAGFKLKTDAGAGVTFARAS